MKIAILTFTFLPSQGGAENFIYNLVDYLIKQGHLVDIYVPKKVYDNYMQSDLGLSLTVKPILFCEQRLSFVCPWILSFALKKYQKKNNYSAWQILGAYPSAYIATPLSKIVPTVLRSFGEDIQIDKSINYGIRLRKRLRKKIEQGVREVTKGVAISKSISDCYKEIGLADDKIINIPNGTNLSRFNKKIDKNTLRKKLGLITGEQFILTTGRYHIKKGYEYIIDAAHQLKNDNIPFKWVLIGVGLDILKPAICAKNLQNNIILLPHIGVKDDFNKIKSLPSDDLIDLYLSSDLYVLPSLIEGMSNVLIEAMAAQLPIVTTDAPGCRDFIEHKTTGLLCKVHSSQDLYLKVKEMIDNKELRHAICANAKEYIKGFDWQNIFKKYELLYQKLSKGEK